MFGDSYRLKLAVTITGSFSMFGLDFLWIAAITGVAGYSKDLCIIFRIWLFAKKAMCHGIHRMKIFWFWTPHRCFCGQKIDYRDTNISCIISTDIQYCRQTAHHCLKYRLQEKCFRVRLQIDQDLSDDTNQASRYVEWETTMYSSYKFQFYLMKCINIM